MPIRRFYFSVDWLIDQLTQLAVISQPMESLEVKSKDQ